MRYFWAFFWTFLLVTMASYVITSMQGGAFDFGVTSIIGIVAAVLIIVVGELLPNEPVEHH